MPTAKLVILDQVNIKFEGLDPGTRRKLVEALEFFTPSARYSHAFRLGRWNGKISFFKVSGQSYFNLLDVLLPIIGEAGYTINLEDKRQEYHFDFPVITEDFTSYANWPEGHVDVGKPIKLRDYQVEIINKLLSNSQAICEAATGSGKTLTSAALSKVVESYGRTLIIVPNKSLVQQTEQDYRLLGLDVGVYFGERKEPGHQHTISTWQSLSILDKKKKSDQEIRKIDEFIDGMVCVITDEAHGTAATILRDLLSTTLANIPIRWGLTGTIPKEPVDAIPLLACIGPVIHKLAAKDLQEKGILANCDIKIQQLQEYTQYETYPEEHDFLVTDKTRLAWLAKHIEKISESGNTLVLVTRTETGRKLEELIPDSVFIYGGTKTKDRTVQYDEIKVADKKVLIATSGIAAVGINIPRIFNLVLLEPGKSFIRTIQSIGRGLRKAQDKDHVTIWDLAATCTYSKRHLSKRKKWYQEAGYPFTIEKIDYLK